MFRFSHRVRPVTVLACASLSVTLGACRSDAISAGPSVCTPGVECPPLDLVVSDNALVALRDISSRITPTLAAPVQQALDLPVARLSAALVARDAEAARVALAGTFDALAFAVRRQEIDPAEASGIRLALLPTAGALGVSAATVSGASLNQRTP